MSIQFVAKIQKNWFCEFCSKFNFLTKNSSNLHTNFQLRLVKRLGFTNVCPDLNWPDTMTRLKRQFSHVQNVKKSVWKTRICHVDPLNTTTPHSLVACQEKQGGPNPQLTGILVVPTSLNRNLAKKNRENLFFRSHFNLAKFRKKFKILVSLKIRDSLFTF